MGTGGPFRGGKARPGRDADHSPPSSAEVVTEISPLPQAPPWRVEGLLYFTNIMYTEPRAEWLVFLLRIREIPGSNVGPEIR
jgi:hypothetical protein